MTTPLTGLLVGMVVLGTATLAMRLVGPALRRRLNVPGEAETLMARAAVVLLAAMVGTAALLDGSTMVGWARPAGVLVAGVLAWRRAPFLLVVIAAAGTAAGLRTLGVA